MPEESKISKAQQKAVNKYVKNNYDRINVTFPKGQKEIIKDHAKRHGESVNAFIVRSVNERMEREQYQKKEHLMNKKEFIDNIVTKVNQKQQVSSSDIEIALQYLHELVSTHNYSGTIAEAKTIGGLLSKALSNNQ